MQLETFTPQQTGEGDRVQAQTMVDKAMIVTVKAKKTGIKTTYSPDGGDALFLDIADLTSGQLFLDVMWMNPTIVDQWTPYLEKTIAVKLKFQTSPKGGNPYLMPSNLEGSELQYAQSWAANNDKAFDNERAKRQDLANAVATPNTVPAPPAPVAPPVATVAPVAAPPVPAPVAPAPMVTAPTTAPAAVGGAGTPAGITPEMAAILEQIKNGTIQLPGA